MTSSFLKATQSRNKYLPHRTHPTHHVIRAEVEYISWASDHGLPLSKPTERRPTLSARASKRAQKSAESHAQAEVFKEMGDNFFDEGRFEKAYISYLEATQIWTSNASLYVRLAMTYTKLEWYEEAAHSATRALMLDPKALAARYIRGVARLEQRVLKAAKIDFETVLKHHPNHQQAQYSLTKVNKLLEFGAHLGKRRLSLDLLDNAAQALDFNYPDYDYEALEIASLSHSSDCNHTGNGIPCRFYNHHGCVNGVKCRYAHAPDEKSVRDDLGRNVCIYHLLDACRFGGSRCVYSHSKRFLSKRGWWTSAKQTANIKSVLELTEKTAKARRALEKEHRILHQVPTPTTSKPNTPRALEIKRHSSNKENEGEVKPKIRTLRFKGYSTTSAFNTIVREEDDIMPHATSKVDPANSTYYQPNATAVNCNCPS